jgi:hypothetical protein
LDQRQSQQETPQVLDPDSPFSIFKLFLLAITLYHRYIDRNSKMEYGINKVINNPLVGGA